LILTIILVIKTLAKNLNNWERVHCIKDSMEGICINFNEKIKEIKRAKIVIMTKKEL
jgi:hypothetical protein